MGIFRSKTKLKILFITSEETPFAKAGGLGEVMFSLPRALRDLGHDARVMTPRYAGIEVRSGLDNFKLAYEDLTVPTAPENKGKELLCNVWRYDPNSDQKSPVTSYFLENQEYYELRSNVYGYVDDALRFALLSRGCLEFLNSSQDWLPDIIVASDWMTGFLPNFLKTDYKEYVRLSSITTVFSIHNIAMQGIKHKYVAEMDRDDGHGPIPDFFSPRMKKINALRRGIMHANVINTVSPTYAQEIMTEEFGEGLDALLRERRSRVYGILNGIDYDTNNPAEDPFLEKKFDANFNDERVENKVALQKRFGLSENKNVFVAGIVSRLTKQKGFDLLKEAMDHFLKISGAQLIVVGSGETTYMDYFQALEKKFPDQVRAHMQFDESMPHLVYGGADVALIPSYFEPSGLTQMEAMRFGAIPVARKIGGLADSIKDYSPEKDEGDGFLFEDFDSISFLMALTRSYVNWRHHDSWKRMQKRAMQKDFSWIRSAKEYEKVFNRAIEIHKEDSEKIETPVN
ncbi:glycogen synthase [Candidatus Giovannonibacteria bacterium]|nr:glycogen synthase [Candidatus Giovannonibacteria bacterium]